MSSSFTSPLPNRRLHDSDFRSFSFNRNRSHSPPITSTVVPIHTNANSTGHSPELKAKLLTTVKSEAVPASSSYSSSPSSPSSKMQLLNPKNWMKFLLVLVIVILCLSNYRLLHKNKKTHDTIQTQSFTLSATPDANLVSANQAFQQIQASSQGTERQVLATSSTDKDEANQFPDATISASIPTSDQIAPALASVESQQSSSSASAVDSSLKSARSLWISSGLQGVDSSLFPPPKLDVVYTWVNGSDPLHIQIKQKFLPPDLPDYVQARAQTRSNRAAPSVSRVPPPAYPIKKPGSGSNRFRDFDELRYSIRSLYKFADQTVGNVYIIATDCTNNTAYSSTQPIATDSLILSSPSRPSTPQPPASSSLIGKFFGRSSSAPAPSVYTDNPSRDLSVLLPIPSQWQRPSWYDESALQDPSVAHPVRMIYHTQLFASSSSSSDSSSSVLPTFNSFAIETQFTSLASRFPSLSRRIIYLNDDFMFGNNILPAHFYSHNYGLVFYLEEGLLVKPLALTAPLYSSPPSAERAAGEWGGLEYSNSLLSARFGMRHRVYVSHYAHVFDTSILEEIQKEWPTYLHTASKNRFRGDGHDLHMAFLFVHYVIERSREVMLKAYLDYNLDKNQDGIWDDEERKELTNFVTTTQLNYKEVGKTPNPQDNFAPIRTTLTSTSHQSSHPHAEYVWSSLDGFPYVRKPRSFSVATTTLPYNKLQEVGGDSYVSSKTPLEKRWCMFELQKCLPKGWMDEGKKMSVDVTYWTTKNLECGDCLLMMLVQASGERGLESILPKEGENGMGERNLREVAINEIGRYQYVVSTATAWFVTLNQLSRQKTTDQMSKKPLYMCINDDSQATPSPSSVQMLKGFFDTLYPNPSPFELPQQ